MIGVVTKLLEGAAAFARGENHLLASAFNIQSILFGGGMWIDATKQLEPLLAGKAGS